MLPLMSQVEPGQPRSVPRPRHVPLAEQTRDGLVESVHYGSIIALDYDGGTRLSAG
ncbi:MAG TPA: asparaginase, partial [Arthrobacter sp.]|nr:asparaginase [Arthrobacter sp.]